MEKQRWIPASRLDVIGESDTVPVINPGWKRKIDDKGDCKNQKDPRSHFPVRILQMHEHIMSLLPVWNKQKHGLLRRLKSSPVLARASGAQRRGGSPGEECSYSRNLNRHTSAHSATATAPYVHITSVSQAFIQLFIARARPFAYHRKVLFLPCKGSERRVLVSLFELNIWTSPVIS